MNNMYEILAKLDSVTTKTNLNESAIVAEKIEPPIKTDPSERGKYKGKDISDLKKMKSAHLKHTAAQREAGKPVSQADKEKTAELNFAIRAKQAHSGKWGKIKESDLEEGVYKDVPDRSKIPAAQRKAAGEQPLTMQDLERERTKSPTTPEGMRALQDKLRKQGHMEETMTPKQKKFAALADPKDKITFADKIAGAKKHSGMNEGDMEEGNDFTGARLDAIRAGKPTFKVAGRTYRVSGDTSQERGMSEARDDDDDDYYGTKTRSHKTASGGTVTHSKGVTRHQAAPGRYGGYNPETDPDKDDDKPDAPAGEKRGRGRPKKTNVQPERVTAKAYKHKGGRKVKEDGHIDFADHGEYDREGEMAQQDLRTAADAAMELRSILDSDENLPEWVQSKITKAVDYLDTSRDYMKSKEIDEGEMDPAMIARFNEPNKKFYTKNPHFTRGTEVKNIGQTVDASGKPISALATKVTPQNKPAPVTKKTVTGFKEEELDEKAVSVAQRRAAGIAHAAQKGEIPKSKLRGASKEMAKMSKDELHKFAATKEKGLPKKKEESVEETTVAGSVAPSAETPKKSKGGMQFGKGVYEGAIAESFDKKLNAMLTESMSINVSASDDGTKNVTVNASDEDAVKLAELLQLAGMGNSEGYSEVCPACGQEPCACDHIEEDLANSPEPVYADTDYMVNGLSGGLDGQKTTGQSVLAPLNRQDSRQGVMSEQAEQRLWDLFKKYK